MRDLKVIVIRKSNVYLIKIMRGGEESQKSTTGKYTNLLHISWIISRIVYAKNPFISELYILAKMRVSLIIYKGFFKVNPLHQFPINK